MTYAIPQVVNEIKCLACGFLLESGAKFCGGCGLASALIPESGNHLLAHWQGKVPHKLPSFASSGVPVENPKIKELAAEANKLVMLLARERLFLYLHWLIFISVNLFGCWVAGKSYVDFVGDTMSKMMVACTPFLFINSLALMSLVPIKGTRSQIAHLKERISYLRFNIEYGHLNL